MITPLNIIDEQAFVTDLIASDYRTADVFKKYGIDFCCGIKWPLKIACELRGLDTQLVKQELQEVIRPIQTSASLPFAGWPLDFLADYIALVHHGYMRQALPSLKEFLASFVTEHGEKDTCLTELQQQFTRLYNNLPACMQQEEDVIFPYIKQVNRSFQAKASFASLLTRTLRKPVEKVMEQEHQLISSVLQRIRELTNNYTLPANACRSHLVVFKKLQELDNDLMQHLHLENTIMLPNLHAIEAELNKK